LNFYAVVASITRRDGKWRARYPHPSPPITQPTKQIERRFTTKKEAEAWLATQTHNILTGSHIDPASGSTTYADLAQAWKATWRSIEPKTQAGYESILTTHLLPAFGRTKLRDLSPARIEAFLSTLTANGVSPGTTRNIFAALRTSLNTAQRLRLVATNPTLGIRPPRPTNKPMLFLTAEEVATLADHPALADYKTLIYTASYTGLRAGELLALQVRDLDLPRGTIHVHRSLKEVNGHLSFGPTKTHRSRTVSLPNFLRGMLATHLHEHLPASGEGPTDLNALVFPGPRGGPLRHGNFYRRHFRPAVQSALPHKATLRFHDLRHTAASLLIASGAHPKLIQARLGHASITTTLDRYGHLFPSVEEALAEMLDAVHASAQRPTQLGFHRPSTGRIVKVIERGRGQGALP
jgi:integrase